MNIRSDFPQLSSTHNNGPIIYLDNAATTLKPQCVIDSVIDHYTNEASNIHRGIHTLSEIGTAKYEKTRSSIQTLINASSTKEIIFTKGTTNSINLVARTFGESHLDEGDEIIISEMEHHSNIVPWQMLCKKNNLTLKVCPVNLKGELEIDKLESLITQKTKLISMVWISNSLGTINPITEIISIAKKYNIKTLVDAAQVIAHQKVDVQKLDCDFLAFSGHKMFGPTGVGVLFGKEEVLNDIPPFEGGGDMIDVVSFEGTTFNELPYKFEAGTPNIAGVIGLGSACEYLMKLDFNKIQKYESVLLAYATEKLAVLPGITLIGTADKKSSVLAFTHNVLHPQDIATFLNKYNVAIRTGHHCTQPLLKKLGVSATARASFAPYNTKEDIDHFINSMSKIIEMFG